MIIIYYSHIFYIVNMKTVIIRLVLAMQLILLWLSRICYQLVGYRLD